MLFKILNGTYQIIKLPNKNKKRLRDLTLEDWNKWKNKKCVDNNCSECIFRSVTCYDSYEECSWIHNKDLYSDKFLNQELEVE